MGVAAQVLIGRATNPGANITAVTPGSGDSLTIANFTPGNPAYLDQVWARAAAPGIVRVRSSRMHDLAQGLRLQVGDTSPRPLLPDEIVQPLYPGDPLTVEMTGGVAETDLAALLVYYTDAPGLEARLAQWAEISGRIRNIAGVEVDCTTSATAGDWSAGRPLNADFDTLRSNTDYAVLGYLTATACGVVAVSGPDTANVKVGGPGAVDHHATRSWFADMSRDTGRPYIPIINSNNRGSTLVSVADPAVSAAVRVTLICAQLQ